MPRTTLTFAALIVVQAAHSVEEYVGRLWESFPPATFVSRLISDDLRRGFAIGNIVLVAFGLWCVLVPVRRRWPSATGLMWIWIVIETINGIGHSLWALRRGGYTPGVATAPILLCLALYLAWQLNQADNAPSRSG